MRRQLEVCCYNVRDAAAALDAGADRVELCAGEPEGGTTPSVGMLTEAAEACGGSCFPMVRPRGGNFTYDSYEFAAMKFDVARIADMGFPGVVFGVLHADNSVDLGATAELVGLAKTYSPSISVTFHRAFDVVPDARTAFTQLAELGIDRVLTSGQAPTALAGIDLIAELANKPGPSVMPGGGVRPDNVSEFLRVGVSEVHSSAQTAPGAGVDVAIVQTLSREVHADQTPTSDWSPVL